MREEFVKLLWCPACKHSLIVMEPSRRRNGLIQCGVLGCPGCGSEYPILNYIRISEERFFGETKWPRDMAGQFILEVGSGSGRFTEQAASTGAVVISCDYSNAVEANHTSNGKRSNVLIVQSDLYNMPFQEEFFDKVFCFGVLQHTPDVRAAFITLTRYLKSGGELAVDVYRKKGVIYSLLVTHNWVRPVVNKLPPRVLYGMVRRYVTFMWPAAKLIHKLPHGRNINLALLIADYRDVYPLSEDMLREWAILDTFDMLSPVYDKPQTLQTVEKWFHEASLSDVDVHYGYNGIEGRGRKE